MNDLVVLCVCAVVANATVVHEDSYSIPGSDQMFVMYDLQIFVSEFGCFLPITRIYLPKKYKCIYLHQSFSTHNASSS